jgi:hypothetical protein
MTNDYSVRQKGRAYFKRDLQAAARMVDGRLSATKYEEVSPHDHKTAARLFGGTWNEAKNAAGLLRTEPGDGSAYGRLTTLEKRKRIYRIKEELV